MRRTLSIAFWCLGSSFGILSSALPQSVVTPTWHFQDYSFNAYGAKTIIITPLRAISNNSNIFVLGDPRRGVTTDSAFTTNLLNGSYYRVELSSGYQVYAFTNFFDTNVVGAVDGGDPLYRAFGTNLDRGVYAYSKAAADARFAPIGSSGGSTNVYRSQVSGSGLTIATNIPSLFYTFSLNTALQLWSAFIPAAYSNGFLASLTNNFTTLTQSVVVLELPFGSAIMKSAATSNAVPAVAGTDYVAPSTTLTLNGTANQITSSAVAQDLSANRIWTFSLPTTLIAPGTITATTSISNGGIYYGNGGGLTNIPATNVAGLPDTFNYPALSNTTLTAGQTIRYAGYTNSDGSLVFTNAAYSSGGGGAAAAFVSTNIFITNTTANFLDLSQANTFRVWMLTNATLILTNTASLTQPAYIYYQQDTNGTRQLLSLTVAGGLLQTNANMQPTTNSSAFDILQLLPGFFTTNVAAFWPQNFQPRVRFTNILAGGGGATLYSNAVMADSPIAYYRLGEASGATFVDISGNSRNLTLASGTPTYGVSGATTDGDKAITCATAVINGQTTPFNPGSSDFSFELWLKSTTTTGTTVAVGKIASSETGDNYWGGFQDGNITVSVNAIGVSGTGGNDGAWHQVVMTKDSSGIILYIDGSQVATGSAPGTCSPAGAFTIGRFGDDTFAGFKYTDSVDEVSFYNTKLSAARVLAHYNAR